MDKNHLLSYKKKKKNHWSIPKLVLQSQQQDITGTDKSHLLLIRSNKVLDF